MGQKKTQTQTEADARKISLTHFRSSVSRIHKHNRSHSQHTRTLFHSVALSLFLSFTRCCVLFFPHLLSLVLPSSQVATGQSTKRTHAAAQSAAIGCPAPTTPPPHFAASAQTAGIHRRVNSSYFCGSCSGCSSRYCRKGSGTGCCRSTLATLATEAVASGTRK